jgi:hypothetical protein
LLINYSISNEQKLEYYRHDKQSWSLDSGTINTERIKIMSTFATPESTINFVYGLPQRTYVIRGHYLTHHRLPAPGLAYFALKYDGNTHRLILCGLFEQKLFRPVGLVPYEVRD